MTTQDWMEKGRMALAEGRTAHAVECFEQATQLDPGNTEAQLQYGLGSLLAGDRKTFERVFLHQKNRMERESSPRLQKLWSMFLRFSGSVAVMATAVTLASSGCGPREKAATLPSSQGDTESVSEEAEPPGKVQTEPEAKTDSNLENTFGEDGEEVYSKHRYSAGVRPPMAPSPFEDEEDGMAPPAKPMKPAPRDEPPRVHTKYGGGGRF